MSKQLKITVGQYTSAGRKPVNQDFHGLCMPDGAALHSKGIAAAIADGISSSEVSQIASETTIKSFLSDYYCTSDSWSVKTSVQKVLLATNSWLYAQNQRGEYRYNKNKGYVCTFTSVVFKSTTAHIFHVGDSRAYHLSQGNLETLTEDHRVWTSKENSYLSRSIGSHSQLDIDYKKVALEVGDVFILMTDGVYESVEEPFIKQAIAEHVNADLDQAAKLMVDKAYQQGSDDNLTVVIVKIGELPAGQADELYQQLSALPFPPTLQARMEFDGYKIIRDIYISSRSHVLLAQDIETGLQVVIKIPSVELRNDEAYLERFLMEEWVAKRLENAHILKAAIATRKRNYIYIVTEFIEGKTLAQWIIDNPNPDVETVRDIVEQISKGLLGFHRQEMLHQDLRPNNIMIDKDGTVKIIDFGAVHVSGLEETSGLARRQHVLGTAQYTAPEYFLGEFGTRRSDLYSLGVIAYQMLSGKMPYGTEMAKARSKLAQRNVPYRTVLDENKEIPAWLDDALQKAVHPDPLKRYGELSEFVFDLRQPSAASLNKTRPPLIERNPLLFWKGLSLFLVLVIIYMSLPV